MAALVVASGLFFSSLVADASAYRCVSLYRAVMISPRITTQIELARVSVS